MGTLVVASYCTTFLKAEMAHIYRQVTALRNVQTFVLTQKLENAQLFPFAEVKLIPKARMNIIRHGWQKLVRRSPPLIYRGEYQNLLASLQSGRADLMHIYFGHTAVHLLPFIERWPNPCVVSFHGADASLRRETADYGVKLRRMFGAVPLVLARSESLANKLIALGCSPDRLRINRAGIPLQEFPYLERTAPKDGRWRVLQACRFIPKKGLQTALRAFAIFQKEYPLAELVFAGKGPLQPQLEELVARLGLQASVRFPGFVAKATLRELYAQSHLFLHPSETPPDEDQEGVPNSILEAMATGLPVAATYHSGIPEAVENRRNGMLVNEGDHLALAEAMKHIVRAPEAFREMGRKAHESIRKNYNQHDQIEQLESYYQEAKALSERSAKFSGGQRVAAKIRQKHPEVAHPA